MSWIIRSLFLYSIMVSTSGAATIIYTNRASFLAAAGSVLIDDFNSIPDSVVSGYTAAQMKSFSVASIGYESTFFGPPDWNLVIGGILCWGCNGSGAIMLDGTTLGGVFAFGIDIATNDASLPYDAGVTFSDTSTQVFDLGTGAGFFGLIDTTRSIERVHFGSNGFDATVNGSFRIDNVTIGNSASVAVPEPAPYLMILGGLTLMARRRSRATSTGGLITTGL